METKYKINKRGKKKVREKKGGWGANKRKKGLAPAKRENVV